jgi:hypothetical protein
MREPDIIKGLFKELIAAPLQRFPNHRSSLIAPMEPGVYVIYGRNGKILHVGRRRGRADSRHLLRRTLVPSSRRD